MFHVGYNRSRIVLVYCKPCHHCIIFHERDIFERDVREPQLADSCIFEQQGSDQGEHRQMWDNATAHN